MSEAEPKKGEYVGREPPLRADGAVLLAGFVVNDSILLLHLIRQRVANGQHMIDPTHPLGQPGSIPGYSPDFADHNRGLLPLLAEGSLQAQGLKPLVISVVFGLLAATLMVLFLVPALYSILADMAPERPNGHRRRYAGRLSVRERARQTEMAPKAHNERGSTDRGTGSPPRGPLRRAWQGLAVTFIGLGGIGVALPLVPTTPFLLLAAWAASRGSPELHAWLYRHPRYGPILRDWHEHRALRPRIKFVALLLITASWLVMMTTIGSDMVRLSASIVMLAVAVFLVTRPAAP
mgnify:CR=1 FL=1